MVERRAGRVREVTSRTGKIQIKMGMGNPNRVLKVPELVPPDPNSHKIFVKVVDLSAEELKASLGPLAGLSFED